MRLFARGIARALVELGVLDGGRHVGGKGAQEDDVHCSEQTFILVKHLSDPDDVTSAGPHRDAQDSAGAIAGVLVDGAIEARIRVGIVNDRRFPAFKDPASNTESGSKADLLKQFALGETREKLIILGVVEEQCTAVSIERFADQGHQTGQHQVQ